MATVLDEIFTPVRSKTLLILNHFLRLSTAQAAKLLISGQANKSKALILRLTDINLYATGTNFVLFSSLYKVCICRSPLIQVVRWIWRLAVP